MANVHLDDERFVTLSNGVVMPRVGLGTWQCRGDECHQSVVAALENGYRHIDTASIYRNEATIAGAIASLGGSIQRKDLFITSKLSTMQQGYQNALNAFRESTRALQTDYLDLYLIHWPGTSGLATSSEENAVRRIESWRALQQLYQEKKCRAIGVSNFTIEHLKHMMQHPDVQVLPHVNQVEFHPLLYQHELLEFCNAHGIQVEAYSSLATGNPALMSNPVVTEMAARVNRTPAQLLLRWGVQHGCVVLPKSKTAERVRSNANIFDFSLTTQQMHELDALNQGRRFCWDPTRIA